MRTWPPSSVRRGISVKLTASTRLPGTYQPSKFSREPRNHTRSVCGRRRSAGGRSWRSGALPGRVFRLPARQVRVGNHEVFAVETNGNEFWVLTGSAGTRPPARNLRFTQTGTYRGNLAL